MEVPGKILRAEESADGARGLGGLLDSGCLLRGSASSLDAPTGCLLAWHWQAELRRAGDSRAPWGFQKIQCPGMGMEWQRQRGWGPRELVPFASATVAAGSLGPMVFPAKTATSLVWELEGNPRDPLLLASSPGAEQLLSYDSSHAYALLQS